MAPQWLQLAEAAVNRICRYDGASEGSLKPLDVTGDVTIRMLDTVLRMSRDPNTYKVFLSPKLAGGCVALMTSVRLDGKAKPFSYEYGYMCFRIFLFSLGVSILSRSGESNFERAIEMMEDPRYSICLVPDVFAIQLVSTLHGLLVKGDEADYDRILGWGSFSSVPHHDPLLSQTQMETLVNMLWESRIDFLRVMSSTFNPGISGFLFLNWRYAYHGQTAGPNCDLVKRTSEIHWRCSLTTPTNQDEAIINICDRFMSLANFVPTKGKFLFQRSIDCRDILRVYIRRLTLTRSVMYDPVPMLMLPMVLELVVPNVEPGLEDLIPHVFGATIDRLWQALREEEFKYSPFLVCIALSLEHFKVMFKSLRGIKVNRPTVANLLKVLAQGSLLDLIASLLLSLDPDVEEDSAKDNTNFNLCQTAGSMLEELALLAPLDLREFYFKDYGKNWSKVYCHFYHLRVSANEPKSMSEHCRRDKHYDYCMSMWDSYMETLGIADDIEKRTWVYIASVPDACAQPIAVLVAKLGTGSEDYIVKPAVDWP